MVCRRAGALEAIQLDCFLVPRSGTPAHEHPVCHSERSEESRRRSERSQGCERPIGFFAPLLMNALFVILDEVRNPRFRRYATRGFFATLRMTNVGLFSWLWIWKVHPRVPRNVGHRIIAGLRMAEMRPAWWTSYPSVHLVCPLAMTRSGQPRLLHSNSSAQNVREISSHPRADAALVTKEGAEPTPVATEIFAFQLGDEIFNPIPAPASAA